MLESWQTLSEEEIDRNNFWTHRRRQFQRPDGKTGTYDFVDKDHAVNIVAQDQDGRFVMIHEYKYLLDAITIGQPAGGIEPGETPEETVARELREETGYEAGTIVPIGRCAGMPFLTNEWIYVYYATDLRLVGEHDDEVVRVVSMTRDEIDEAIRDGRIWDSHTIAAWYMAKLHLGL